eukprot:3578008-Prymnesium_polylepis.1
MKYRHDAAYTPRELIARRCRFLFFCLPRRNPGSAAWGRRVQAASPIRIARRGSRGSNPNPRRVNATKPR